MKKQTIFFLLILVIVPTKIMAAMVSQNDTGKKANDFHIELSNDKKIDFKFDPIDKGKKFTFPKGYHLYTPINLAQVNFTITDAYWTFDGTEIGKATIADDDGDSYDPSLINTLALASPVPVPAAIWLFLSGLASLNFYSTKKKLNK